jgi:ssDNA-binding Zn-finger/Zn-ribbon topoisomerase 1
MGAAASAALPIRAAHVHSNRCDTVRTIFPIACPQCGSDEHLRVALETWAEPSADGTEPAGDHDWNAYSACRCTSCDLISAVENFRVAPDAAPPPPKTVHVSFWECDRYHADLQAADTEHARRLAEAMLANGGPDSFEVTSI